jgi:hypothetical protein
VNLGSITGLGEIKIAVVQRAQFVGVSLELVPQDAHRLLKNRLGDGNFDLAIDGGMNQPECLTPEVEGADQLVCVEGDAGYRLRGWLRSSRTRRTESDGFRLRRCAWRSPIAASSSTSRWATRCLAPPPKLGDTTDPSPMGRSLPCRSPFTRRLRQPTLRSSSREPLRSRGRARSRAPRR